MKLNEQDGAEDLKKLDHKLTAEFAVSLALKKKKIITISMDRACGASSLGSPGSP